MLQLNHRKKGSRGDSRGSFGTNGPRQYNPNGRNLRSVWNIATQPFPEAHFATFPQKLVEKCIKAGISEKGACPKCGASWVRVVERPRAPKDVMTKCNTPDDGFIYSGNKDYGEKMGQGQKLQNWREQNPSKTLGWQPSCKCLDNNPIPATVLDPFAGSGTVGLVAAKLQRNSILIEMKSEYCNMARKRIKKELGFLAEVT